MKWMLVCTVLLSLVGSTFCSDISLTVYTDRALVHERRTIEVQKGIFSYHFTDIPSKIDPTSVHFTAKGVEILEQNYEFDIASSDKILDKMAGSRIMVYLKDGSLIDGILQPAFGDDFIIRDSQGGVSIVKSGEVMHYDFQKMPEGFVDRPTLIWLLSSQSAGKKTADVSYITGGMGWHAEYIAVLSEEALGFSGWVSIDNRSGQTYNQAKLKLMAGDIHFADERNLLRRARKGYAGIASTNGRQQFQEKAFFEYHLYTLKRKSTLRNNQIKQIALFPEAKVDYQKEFIYQARSGDKVGVFILFKNTKNSGLGIPLPAGKVRVYQQDDDGTQELIGEDLIEHTPKDEKISLQIGKAFDIRGEREVVDSRKLGRFDREEDIEITLRNHKSISVDVTVKEYLRGNWKIINSSHKYIKVNAYTIEFKVTLPAHKEDEKTLIKYTVRYSQR